MSHQRLGIDYADKPQQTGQLQRVPQGMARHSTQAKHSELAPDQLWCATRVRWTWLLGSRHSCSTGLTPFSASHAWWLAPSLQHAFTIQHQHGCCAVRHRLAWGTTIQPPPPCHSPLASPVLLAELLHVQVEGLADGHNVPAVLLAHIWQSLHLLLRNRDKRILRPLREPVQPQQAQVGKDVWQETGPVPPKAFPRSSLALSLPCTY